MAKSNSGVSRANQNRKIRQDELRASLVAGGHIQHVVDIAEKLQDLDSEDEIEGIEVQRLKVAADIKLKLIDKYLPSLKAIEHSGEGGDDIPVSITLNFKNTKK